MSGHRLRLYQDIVYFFWYNLSPKKGENYNLERNNNDGAENRVYKSGDQGITQSQSFAESF
jgi:hypothetical protein